MRMIRSLFVLVLAVPAMATNFIVKAAGGGSFTTIQACSNGMSAGDTCTVYANTAGGTTVYAENVSVTAGTVGNYKTFTVNPGDTVQVLSFSIGSHIKINGFTIQNPSSPTNAPCVSIGTNATDWFITSNVMASCGPYMIDEGSTNATDQAYIGSNTLSYSCSTSASPNVCNMMRVNGNHHLFELNDYSHIGDGPYWNGKWNIMRKNKMHDILTTDCGSNSGNCHIDFMQADGSGGPSSGAIQFILLENNTVTNMTNNGGSVSSPDVHAIGLFQNVNNATHDHGIVRYHKVSHVDEGGLFNDTNNWGFLKDYNNSYVDVNRTLNASGELFNTFTTGLNASSLNDIFYFTSTLNGFAAYGFTSTSTPTATYGHSLAFCTQGSSSCNTIYSHLYGSGIFSSDPGNILNSDPLFVNYAGNNFNLQPLSLARNAGIAPMTVSGSITNSTTLVVNDASFLQDSWGFTVGNVQPDCIWVTVPANHVCITSGGINYATNTITLATAISATNGDPVGIYSISDGTVVQTDTGVDMGAFPFSTALPIPPPVVFVDLMQPGASSW